MVRSSNKQQNTRFAEKNYKIRAELCRNGKLNFLNKKIDTLWILESQLIESGIMVGRIWNKEGNVEYSFPVGMLDSARYKPFSQHLCELVENWDTLKIKMEERTQQIVFDSKYVYATRVIKTSKGIKIEHISFSDLVKPLRDDNY